MVQNRSRVCVDRFDSRRIWYPTVSPSSSPLSDATRAATDMADIRRGWVHIMLQSAPRRLSISSSSMNCGSCVVLPQPVSPEMTRTWYDKNPIRYKNKRNGCTNKSNSRTLHSQTLKYNEYHQIVKTNNNKNTNSITLTLSS